MGTEELKDLRRCSAVLYTRDGNFNLNVLLIRDRTEKHGGEWRLPSKISKPESRVRDDAAEAIYENTPIESFDEEALRLRYVDDGDFKCCLEKCAHFLFGMYYDGPFDIHNDESDPIEIRWFNVQFVREMPPEINREDLYLIKCYFEESV